MNPLNTWSTWDVRCLNAVMKAPELVEVRLIAYDSKSRQMIDEMRWESLVKLGPHNTDGSYFDIVLKAWNNVFELAFATNGDQFTLHFTPLEATPTLRFFVAGLFRWNTHGSIEHASPHSLTLMHHATCNTFHITTLGTPDLFSPINITHPGILMDGSQPFYVRCNHEMSVIEMDALLAEKKDAWLVAQRTRRRLAG